MVVSQLGNIYVERVFEELLELQKVRTDLDALLLDQLIDLTGDLYHWDGSVLHKIYVPNPCGVTVVL